MTGLRKGTILTSQKANLVELLNTATKNQLFQFEGRLYVRTLVDGVAMGSPLGPLMAIVFISSIEERLQDEGKMAQYCKHHVDDTLSIMPDVEITLKHSPAHLKVRHPSVNSTMELAESWQTSFP